MARSLSLRRIPRPLWLLAVSLAAAAIGSFAGASQPPPRSSALRQSADSSQKKSKSDIRKAKEDYKQGLAAEKRQDWTAAFQAFREASALDATNREYALRREITRSRAAQSIADSAERDAVAGRLDDARRELEEAHLLDPSNSTLSERFREMNMESSMPVQPAGPKIELTGEIHLATLPGTRNFNLRGTVQDAYLEVAHQFGVDAVFDEDLIGRPVRLQANGVDFKGAMQMLQDMTGTFWRPLTSHLFFVAENTPQKRKDYDASVTRTVLLPASETNEQMTEVLRMVRDIAGVVHSDLNTNTRTLTMRADPQSIAVATDLVDHLEKPLGQLVLEIEILQVNRTYAQQLGITPPQSGHLYTVSPQQVQEALQSENGLISVIEQLFGTPSSLQGLTPTQIASLLSSNQLTGLIPPVVVIGGGNSRFLTTLPGATANFSELLSLIRDGRRVLLRAEDGQPATFFVGDHIPVSLAQFSASLGGAGVNVPGVNSTEFPTTNYPTGNAPAFITAADVLGSGVDDLLVANFSDNTVSYLQGNGDGTFQTQVPIQVGTGPVSIATGHFGSDTNLDIAVANENSNTISILLGNGDGTFQPQTTIATGNQPVSVIAAGMHDKTAPGVIDLVVANHKDSTIAIYPGIAAGGFQTPTLLTLPAGYLPSCVIAADFNADGHLDLAVTDQGNNSVSIFLGNGDGTFQNRVDYPVGNSPVWVSAADFNADGILDLAVANNGQPTATLAGNSVSILLGQANPANTSVGSGAFGTQVAYAAGTAPTSIAVADYNVDGIPDLAVTASQDNSVAILLGQGPGTFGPFFELGVGTDPVSVATADFNSDGRSDVAVANNGSNNATVILNSANFTPGNGLSGTPFPGAQYIDIGLKMKATPRIHPDNEVTLQLEFDISSITSQSFNGIPVISNDAIEQTVRLREGETSVLAGILQAQVMKAISGTPGLADIPVLGGVEGDQSAQNADSELLILVTPRMVYLAPRKDREIYAGRGVPEIFNAFGPGRTLREGEGPAFEPSPGRPVPPPNQQQEPVEPQPRPLGEPAGQPVGQPVGQPPINQQNPPQAPQQQQQQPNEPQPQS
jgi:type II secretory pathway component GspD/PulD (secretin)